jgi:uncharacterized protein YqgC (DUF456 family)
MEYGEILIFVFSIGLIIVGLIGSFLPILPGPPIAWLGLLIYHIWGKNEVSPPLLWGSFIAVVLIQVLDYLLPFWGAKKMGASNYGTWGSVIGGVLGIFAGPFGIILGPFFGALIGEWIFRGKLDGLCLKAAWGTFFGFLAGTALKVIFCIWLLVQLIQVVIN